MQFTYTFVSLNLQLTLFSTGDSLNHAVRIEALTDRETMTVTIDNMKDAVLYLMATYFCFGIEYSSKAANTLDFIQR